MGRKRKIMRFFYGLNMKVWNLRELVNFIFELKVAVARNLSNIKEVFVWHI